MKLRTQLYIDTSDNALDEEATYELVDFFDFESIEMTETIKNLQDIGVVFSDYSQSFVVPASKMNNRIFSHYYNTNLLNSFDARIKKRARIFINGLFFKQGFIRLNSSEVKDGYAYSYELEFFGALSGLEDLMGEDKLSSLTSLEKYRHEFNVDNVFSGLKKGLVYNGTEMEEATGNSRDIVYPLISTENKLVYDTDLERQGDLPYKQGVSNNIHNDQSGLPNPDYGIEFRQLKPAIKLTHIIDAIDEKYASINFKKDSFLYSQATKDLYLYLHNQKGPISLSEGFFETQVKELVVSGDVFGSPSAFDLSNPQNVAIGSNFFGRFSVDSLFPITTNSKTNALLPNGSRYDYKIVYELSLDITSLQPATGDVSYEILLRNRNTSEVLGFKRCTTIQDTLIVELETEEETKWRNLAWEVKSTGGLVRFDAVQGVYKIAKGRATGTDDDFSYLLGTYAEYLLKESQTNEQGEAEFKFDINISQQMPDIKITNFLSGLFKMYNLNVFLDENGEIDALPLNDFYAKGVDRDITNYVDTANFNVQRLQLYGQIDFSFEEESTFGLINHNQITRDNFGNLRYPEQGGEIVNNLVFDQSKYEVQVPFEKIYYSRLSDENENTLLQPDLRVTNITEGWLVDDDQEPTLTKPILFYNINTTVDINDYKFGMKQKAEFISTYNRPSNSSLEYNHSLNFNAEIDEYGLEINENSLFKKYYESYIANTFNRESRKISIKARLPLSFLLNYSLADRLLINGSAFRIDEISTDLTTGMSSLDLYTSFSIDEEIFPPDTLPPSNVTGLSLEFISAFAIGISWDENSETDMAGYRIYLDGVLVKTVGLTNNATIYNVQPSTSYDVQVTAFNTANKESLLSSAMILNVTTLEAPDEAPSPPTQILIGPVSSSSFVAVWFGADQNSIYPIDFYTLYLDGVAYQTTTETQMEVTGLSPNTTYVVTISATNTLGTEGQQSLASSILTLP